MTQCRQLHTHTRPSISRYNSHPHRASKADMAFDSHAQTQFKLSLVEGRAEQLTRRSRPSCLLNFSSRHAITVSDLQTFWLAHRVRAHSSPLGARLFVLGLQTRASSLVMQVLWYALCVLRLLTCRKSSNPESLTKQS